jgi:hypothetical protein
MKFEVPGYLICECIMLVHARELLPYSITSRSEVILRAFVPRRGNHEWRYQICRLQRLLLLQHSICT